MRSLENWSSPPRVVGEHPAGVPWIAFHPDGRTLAASDGSGGIRVWSTSARSERPLRVLEGVDREVLRNGSTGKWLGAWVGSPNLVRLFDLTAPLSSAVLQLRGPSELLHHSAFEPSDRWLATLSDRDIALWPLGESYPRSIGRHEWYVDDMAFTPDGSRLLSVSGGLDSALCASSLSVGDVESESVLLREPMNYPGLAVDSRGGRAAVSTGDGIVVVPVAGGARRTFEGFSAGTLG